VIRQTQKTLFFIENNIFKKTITNKNSPKIGMLQTECKIIIPRKKKEIKYCTHSMIL